MKHLKPVLATVMVLAIAVCLAGCKADDYEAAAALYDSGDYSAAAAAFAELGDYEDSADRAVEAQKAHDYEAAAALYNSGDYSAAAAAFAELGNYKDSADRAAAAEAQAAEDERLFIVEVTEKIVDIEAFASVYTGKDYYSNDLLDSFPEWDENYALYLRLIEKDSEERTALAERFKNALGDIEEMRFYTTANIEGGSHYFFLEDEDFDSLEMIASHIETLGFSDKMEEINKELTQQRYGVFYNTTRSTSYLDFGKALTEIAIFPDSEVKTIAEQALSFGQECTKGLTRENAERALSLSDELDDLATSLQDMEQPDYYLRGCLAYLRNYFEDYNYDYRSQSARSMEKSITPELEAYYAKTSAGKAPIEITGNELYVAPFTYEFTDTGEDFGINEFRSKLITDDSQLYMHFASKPKEARYLINFSATTLYDCTYYYDTSDKVTKGYSVNVTLYLKDCKTGEILYTQSFSAATPYTITVNTAPPEAYYASIYWAENDIDKIISVLQSTLGIE